MRTRPVLAFALCFAMATALLAQAADAKPAEKTMKAKSAADRLVVADANGLKWTDLDPKGAPGVKIVDLWGDHSKGAFGAFLKFPAGFAAPLHTHTSGMKIVIISGTVISGPEGKPEVRLGPGSYFWQPGGNYRHTTACDKASECLFFSESTGKFDIKPVG